MDLPSFLAWTVRVNVLEAHPGRSGKGDAFHLPTARKLTTGLLARLAAHPGPVVLLGRGVASALGRGGQAWFEWVDGAAVAPHPSGISHWWNDPANIRRARRFWRALRRGCARRC